MNRALNKLLAIGLATASILAACQKEPSSGRLRLMAEGMGGNTKMTVSDTLSYWQNDDMVNVNGTEATVTIGGTSVGTISGDVVSGGETAYIDGEFSAEEYYIVFPAAIYQGRTGDVVTVNMPSSYTYTTGRILNSYTLAQVLNAPMAYYGTAEGGKVTMKHLTGALNLVISGPSGITIDKITIGTTQNRVLSGEMQFDLSDMDNIGSSATNASANNTIVMYGGPSSGKVQIPVPVLTGNVNFTITVEGHAEGTKYTFSRTQATGGHLGRREMATVNVDLNEGQTGVTTSALFPTTTVGGKTYYEISTPKDLQLMSDAVYGTAYREDGDTYTRKWEYNGLYYRDANYLVVSDIDMGGYYFTAIDYFSGEFNGGNHTISNLTVSGLHDTEYPIYWGVFEACYYGTTMAIKDATFSNLTVKTRNCVDYPSYCGALVGLSSGDLTIENVTVTGFSEVINSSYGTNTSNHKEYCLGGFVGRLYGNVAITSSSVSFAADQQFTHKQGGVVNVGGIVGEIYSNSAAVTLDDVQVAFGTMTFDVSNATRKFGGLINEGYYFSNVTAASTTVTGDITFTAGSNTAGLVAPGYATKEGVDVSGLTITTN